MQTIIAKPFKFRFIMALIGMCIIATMFWTQSRYPALDDKAIMAGSIQLEDPLSFEAVLPIERDFPLRRGIGAERFKRIYHGEGSSPRSR